MATPFSIRTRYNGTLYRSKLEADWARTFDALGISYEYEKEGQYFGEVFYLPDFFLPKSRQYIEVKGDTQRLAGPDGDKIKACALHAPPSDHADYYVHEGEGRPPHGTGIPEFAPITVCLPHGVFISLDSDGRAIGETSALFQCAKCTDWWFADENGGWKCMCCGAYDGDGHLAQTVSACGGIPTLVPHIWPRAFSTV